MIRLFLAKQGDVTSKQIRWLDDEKTATLLFIQSVSEKEFCVQTFCEMFEEVLYDDISLKEFTTLE
jgi:hypothetical protein